MIGLQAPSQIINNDEELLVKRPVVTNPVYIDGILKPQPDKTFRIICNVQPINGRDLLLVPEGDRHKEQYYIWIQNYDQERILDNDIVWRLGISYQTQSTEQWGDYTRARMVRIDVGPLSDGQGS
jgi:hypothetical protein